MAGKCKVLYWDQNDRVSGVVVSLQADGTPVMLASAAGIPGMPLPAQLQEVNAELKHNQADVILVGGFVPEFICTEFYLPNLDRARLKNSLLFELPRRLPILADGMVCFFRPISSADPHRLKVRVWAVKRQIWSELENRLQEAAIKIDAFCHPFLAAELDERHPTAEFPQVAPGLMLIQGESGLARMVRRDVSGLADKTGEVLAAYGLSRNFRQDKIYISEIPENLRLHRFTKSRNLAFLLGLLIMILGGALIYRHWEDRDRQQEAYRRELLQLDSKIRSMNGRIEEVKTLGEFARKMQDARDDTSILAVFEMLTEKLPANVWVHSFRAGNHQIALTLSVAGDAAGLNESLADLPDWNILNLRQQRGSDGKEIWYITLQHNMYRNSR